MQRITAQIGLAILTVALAACTGNPTGSANFIPQNQARHATDLPGGPVNSTLDVVSSVTPGGPGN
jgi:hypothetical protein